jgi:hypothetical protein
VKNAVRLLIFTFTSFTIVFALSAVLSFLHLWIVAAATIPVERFITLNSVTSYLHWTVPLSFYLALLLSINYALHNNVHRLLAFIMVCAISGGLTFAVSKGLDMADRMDAPPFLVNSGTLGGAGLLLRHGDVAVTLLDSPSNPDGGRVVSIPGRSIFDGYEAGGGDAAGGVPPLPPAPFSLATNWFFEDMYTDCALSAAQFRGRFENGVIPFITWMIPLEALLVSLAFIFNVGAWPLSNLFLGAVMFRLTLWFEVFINSKDIQAYLNNFFRGMVPLDSISPLIVAVLGGLFLLYLILMYLAVEKVRHGRY